MRYTSVKPVGVIAWRVGNRRPILKVKLLAQTLKGFALVLPRFLRGSCDGASCRLSGLRLSLPLFDARCGFFVELASYRCRSSLRTQAQYDDFFFIPALFDD